MVDHTIYPGYCVDGRFYPIDTSHYGYWYNNAFYNHDSGWDFSQAQDAYPVTWSQQTSYKQLPYGSRFLFYYQYRYYNSYEEASQAYQQAYRMSQGGYQGYGMASSQYQEMQTYPQATQACYPAAVMQTYTSGPPLPQPAQVFPNFSPSGVTIREGQVAPPRTTSTAQKSCTLCRQQSAVYLPLFGKVCCIDCLEKKYQDGQLFLGEGESKMPWTGKLIVEVHRFLAERLPVERQQLLPPTFKLPLDSFVCCGKTEVVEAGYPPNGHITYNPNKCMEEGCPNHEMCKSCAKDLIACPICQHEVIFEELPVACPPDCKNHKHSFKEPCVTCGKITPRQKKKKEE